jgi:hypothetical protein
MDRVVSAEADQNSPTLTASVQVLPLPPGLYAFTIAAGGATGGGIPGAYAPSVQVALAPVPQHGRVTFLTAPTTTDRWLTRQDDAIVVRIDEAEATLLLTSLRPAAGPVLAIDARRLDVAAEAAGQAATPAQPHAMQHPPAVAPAAPAQRLLRTRVTAHVQRVGDVTFAETGWAGHAGQGLWIEALGIQPVDELPAGSLEYRVVGANGFETSWVGNGGLCGSKGLGVPITGLSIRLTPDAAATHDLEFSARFVSGTVVGPLAGDEFCQSPVLGDPLEAIQLRIVERSTVTAPGLFLPIPSSHRIEGAHA